jgi:hypothetical protein
MNYLRISFGCFMDFLWMFYGVQMDFLWISIVGFQLISFRFLMEFKMDFVWIPYGLLM